MTFSTRIGWISVSILLLAAGIAQAQPAPPSLSADNTGIKPPTTPPNRSQYRLASVPHMFGDFLGADSLGLSVQLPSRDITQTFPNGGGLGTFQVFRAGTNVPGAGGVGTSIDIKIGNTIISQGSGGQDRSGDNIADTFTITEPTGSAPTGTGPGTIVYKNGQAVYVKDPASGSTTPANGTDANGWILQTAHTFTPAALKLNIPAGGASVRRMKIGENNSPEPRDRVLFDYNFFNDVQNGLGDVHRYTAGVEKTFDEGNQSFEVRIPFISTLTSDLLLDGANGNRAEFGDLTVIWKKILVELDGLIFTGGVGVATPTGQDTRVKLSTGPEILRIQNRSVHLLPYFAVLVSPSEDYFAQAFVQVDVDANGNPVQGDVTGANLAPLGRLTDQTVLFVDLSVGYHWFHDPEAEGLTGVAPMVELHYATSTQDADHITGGGFDLTDLASRFDILNLTLATNFQFEDRYSIRPGLVIPLRRGNDRVFDYEFMVQANMAF